LNGQLVPDLGNGTFTHLFRHGGAIPSAFQDQRIIQFQVDNQCFDLSSLLDCHVSGSRVVVVGHGKTNIFPSVSGDASLREATQTIHIRGICTRARSSTDEINTKIKDAPAGFVYLTIRGLGSIDKLLDRIRTWIRELKRRLYFISMFRKDEYLPQDCAGLVPAWATFGLRLIRFSVEELFAETLSEEMQLLKQV
jgi:hypothetical protein